jgi:hypothetical protein
MTESQTKPTYWACWWRATWIIFIARALLGFLSMGEAGLATGIGSGLIIAPLGGLFWGWIYWLIKK